MENVPINPNWRKGDVIAMPTDLRHHNETRWQSVGISNGCSVFVAEQDPCDSLPNRQDKGTYYYGWTNAKCFRLATVGDIDRLIEIQQNIVEREQSELERLDDMRYSVLERLDHQ